MIQFYWRQKSKEWMDVYVLTIGYLPLSGTIIQIKHFRRQNMTVIYNQFLRADLLDLLIILLIFISFSKISDMNIEKQGPLNQLSRSHKHSQTLKRESQDYKGLYKVLCLYVMVVNWWFNRTPNSERRCISDSFTCFWSFLPPSR